MVAGGHQIYKVRFHIFHHFEIFLEPPIIGESPAERLYSVHQELDVLVGINQTLDAAESGLLSRWPDFSCFWGLALGDRSRPIAALPLAAFQALIHKFEGVALLGRNKGGYLIHQKLVGPLEVFDLSLKLEALAIVQHVVGEYIVSFVDGFFLVGVVVAPLSAVWEFAGLFVGPA